MRKRTCILVNAEEIDISVCMSPTQVALSGREEASMICDLPACFTRKVSHSDSKQVLTKCEEDIGWRVSRGTSYFTLLPAVGRGGKRSDGQHSVPKAHVHSLTCFLRPFQKENKRMTIRYIFKLFFVSFISCLPIPPTPRFIFLV